VEEKLGAPVSDEAWEVLTEENFARTLETALGKLLSSVQNEPLVAAAKGIESERSRGLALQRLPLSPQAGPGSGPRIDGQGHLIVNDINMVRDVPTARLQVVRLAQYLFDHGELLPQAEALHTAIGPHLADILGHLAANLIEPNLSINQAATRALRAEAQARVQPVKISIKKNEMIIRDGERLSARHLMILRGIGADGISRGALGMATGGLIIFVLMGGLACLLLGLMRRDRASLTARDLLFLATLFLLSLTFCRGWLSAGRVLQDLFHTFGRQVWLFCLPVSMGALVTRLVLRQELALLFAVLHSLALTLLADGDRLLSAYALVGCVAAVVAIRSISARSDLLRAGLYAGLAQGLCAIGILMFEGTASPMTYVVAPGAALFGGLSAAVLALSITPMLEWTFNYTTDLKLLELANLNHPALKELIVQAPGSYHHSIVVGALVEAAAESVGANSLLARVMAYYHDLGKGCNSGYFIENQRLGQNPHDKLRPSMSAMIIRRHVTDGIALAKHYGLGEQITAGIAQHHGNTLIHVFYHKACEQAEPGQVVNEADYRYPGQKPQTREAALVMLGDSIEAASRALADPTAARLQGLVNRIISSKFADGQLEECDLTLRDLHTIAKSFQTVLTGIYHHRLAYPDVLQENVKKGSRVDLDSKSPRSAEDDLADAAGTHKDHLKRLGLS
jgi:putative nucleotidyltransferase with HDIG domain